LNTNALLVKRVQNIRMDGDVERGFGGKAYIVLCFEKYTGMFPPPPPPPRGGGGGGWVVWGVLVFFFLVNVFFFFWSNPRAGGGGGGLELFGVLG